MVKDKTTGLSEAEAVAKIQKLTEEQAVKAEESHIKLSDVFRDETTGKVTLPVITPRGIALLELVGNAIQGENVTSMEQMLMVLWALKNQNKVDARKALRLSSGEVRDEVDALFDKIELSEFEDYADAVEQAMASLEESTSEGNPRKGKARRGKTKATKKSGS